jgi:hypothetical protein
MTQSRDSAYTWIRQNTKWWKTGDDSISTTHDRVYVVAMPERRDEIISVLQQMNLFEKAWILEAFHKRDLSISSLES